MAAAVVAGGNNSRMQGVHKALMTLNGRPVISHVVDEAAAVFDPVCVIANEPLLFAFLDRAVFSDVVSCRSSLTGIHAALFHAPAPHVCVLACDMPFVTRKVLTILAGAVTDRDDVVVFETPEGLEPLCAVYSTRCLRPVARQLARGRFQISRVFESLRVKKLPAHVLRDVDPHGLAFVNINTPEDLDRARHLMERQGRSHD